MLVQALMRRPLLDHTAPTNSVPARAASRKKAKATPPAFAFEVSLEQRKTQLIELMRALRSQAPFFGGRTLRQLASMMASSYSVKQPWVVTDPPDLGCVASLLTQVNSTDVQAAAFMG